MMRDPVMLGMDAAAGGPIGQFAQTITADKNQLEFRASIAFAEDFRLQRSPTRQRTGRQKANENNGKKVPQQMRHEPVPVIARSPRRHAI